MNIKIVKNKYVNSFFAFLLLAAIIHFLILAYRTIAERNIYNLNFFAVLNLDALFPNFFKDNFAGNLTSFLFAGIVYLILLIYENKTE